MSLIQLGVCDPGDRAGGLQRQLFFGCWASQPLSSSRSWYTALSDNLLFATLSDSPWIIFHAELHTAPTQRRDLWNYF